MKWRLQKVVIKYAALHQLRIQQRVGFCKKKFDNKKISNTRWDFSSLLNSWSKPLSQYRIDVTQKDCHLALPLHRKFQQEKKIKNIKDLLTLSITSIFIHHHRIPLSLVVYCCNFVFDLSHSSMQWFPHPVRRKKGHKLFIFSQDASDAF